MKRILFVFAATMILPACSQFHVPPYSVNHKSVSELRKIRDDSNVMLSVGTVSGEGQDLSTLMCRGVGPVKSASSGTFGQYIKDAIIAEMSIAEVYLEQSDIQIELDFSKFDFTSTSGEWEMAANVRVRGLEFPVSIKHSFSPSWFGETACDQTAQAMMPAVQEFVYRLVSNQQFHRSLAGSVESESTETLR